VNRIVGFDRQLKRDWLNTTLAFVQAGLSPDEVRLRLNDALSDAITGPESRRKAIIVLTRLWCRVPAQDRHLQERAIDLAAQIRSDELLWLHWGMSLLAYPFFRDSAAIVGQLGHLQGPFTYAQVQRRMFETWGQREMLPRALNRLLRTLTEFKVLQETHGRGGYAPGPVHQTQNQALALWLIECSLHAHEAEQVPLSELGRLPYTFPFDLAPHLVAVRRSDRFEITRQGLDLEMVSIP